MTAILTRSPERAHFDDDEWIPDDSGPTLADVVARSWEVLRAELPATCPVCGGELLPHESATGGRCSSCGSSLT